MNKIKLLVILLFVFSANIMVFSQYYNSKLLVKYDSQILANINQKNNSQFKLFEYFNGKGFYFVDMRDKPIKIVELEKIDPLTGETVNDFDLSTIDFNNINPLFKCNYNDTRNSYYKVGNIGKLLIVTSHDDIENKIENEKRILKNRI
jgi:hypothetical protein